MFDQPPIKKVGLIGPFGYGNLGDAAIQEAMIQHIRKRLPDAEIVGFSLNPEDTEARHGIKSYPISRMSWKESQDDNKTSGAFARLRQKINASPNPTLKNLDRWMSRAPIELSLWRAAWKHLAGIDALIVSGGGQLDDYWGGGGPWSHPYTLLKWGLLTRLRKGKFMFVSVGAGPIDAKLSQHFIKLALGLANYRSYRDQYSKNLVEKIGFQNNDPVYPDLAHSLIINQHDGNGARPKRQVVGVGPIGYFRAGCWPEHDQVIYTDYLAKMTAFVAWLLDKQYAVVFLPGETHYDGLVIDDLKQALHASGVHPADDQIIMAPIQTLDELLNQLAHTDFVVGSRFHNVLLAQLLEKPVLAISYQAKIESLMSANGQANFCVPVSSFKLDQLKALFTRLENDCNSIKKQLAERAPIYSNALEGQYERIFAEF